MENLPPPNDNLNAPEEEPFMDQAHAAFVGFAPQWIGEQIPNNKNGWLEEEPEEEEKEDEDMEDDEEDDAEVINPYEEADPHNRPPPTSDEETEYAPPVVQVVDVDNIPIPPVIQFGNLHVGESSVSRDLLEGNSEVCVPGLMPCDLRSVHRGVKRLSKQMHDIYKTDKRMEKILRQEELRRNGQAFDITALDSAVRANRSESSKMMRLITDLSREFSELKSQNHRAEELSRWEAWVRGRITNSLQFQEEPSIYIAPVPRADDPYVMVRDAARGIQEDEDVDIVPLRDTQPPETMPPKRRSQTNPQLTLTQEDVDQLVQDGIAAAIRDKRERVRREATKAEGPARDPVTSPIARECSFASFMKCGPTQFHRTEGARCCRTFATLGHEVANARSWAEVKQMMTDEFCPTEEVQRLEDELRHLKLRDMNIAAYTERFNGLALLCPDAVPNEKKKVELYIKGLPEIIKGLKRKWENNNWGNNNNNHNRGNYRNNHHHNQNNNRRQNNARALTTAQNTRANQTRVALKCNRCGKCHFHQCPSRCENYGKVGHKAKDYRGKNVAPSAAVQPNIVCYSCGERGHKSSECSKKADQRGGNVQGQAYVIRDAEHNQGPNVVTGTFLLNNRYATMLFDSRADKSLVDIKFSHLIDIKPVKLNSSYDVELADEKVVSTNSILKGCTLNLLDHLFDIDLMPIELGTFDVIVRMDLLVERDALIVKEYQKKDKIGSKPDKNGKRGEAEKSQKQLQSVEEEKLKKIQKEGPNLQSIPSFMKERRKEGLKVQINERYKSSSKLAHDQTSNPTSSTNPTPKGRICRSSKQKVENSHFEEHLTPVATMTDNRTMAEMLRAPTEVCAEAIVVPPILAEQFELKHSLINMMTSEQFFRLKKDNPHDHIHTFYNALNPADQYFLNAAVDGNLLEKSPQDALTIIENKSKVCNSRSKPIASPLNACENHSSFEIAKLTHAVNQQTSAVTTAMTAMLKHLQSNPPPAQVKAVEEICFTCGGAHPYYQCLAAGGNTFLEYQDNIQGYVSAATGNYNQGNLGYRPQGVANQMRPPGSGTLPGNTIANPKGKLKAITTRSELATDGPTLPNPPKSNNPEEMNEKLQELANTPLNENCSAVILKNLPEKLGDPGKFLIPCGFSELKCKALADLGASINLMPLSVWKKLGLPDLILTRMTLELANRVICTPDGIARDVFVLVGKFTFPTDFVIVDYESDPRVPLILGRPFLRTARALIDVYGEEMILCDGDESEDCLEDLVSKKQSGNPTFSLHKEITSSEVIHEIHDSKGTTYSANSLLEEFADELTLITYPPGYDDNRTCDIESDIREIEFLLYQGEDSDFKDSIDQSDLASLDDLFVDPTPEMFTDEQPPDYSFPLRFDVYPDDFLEIESDANFDDDFFDSKGEKIKEAELLIDQLDLHCDILSEYDSFNSQDFSRDDVLPSSDDKDKVFNPGILIHEKSVKIVTRVAQEKKLGISYASLLFEEFDPPFYELLVFKAVPNSMRLLPFSSENEENIFKPGIYTSKKVHFCFLSELSHPGFHVFKVNLIFISLMKIFHAQSGKNTPPLDVLLFYFYPP
nr:reverse transcriptase domain-containing protein [Tanacetum cinerariifolium]